MQIFANMLACFLGYVFVTSLDKLVGPTILTLLILKMIGNYQFLQEVSSEHRAMYADWVKSEEAYLRREDVLAKKVEDYTLTTFEEWKFLRIAKGDTSLIVLTLVSVFLIHSVYTMQMVLNGLVLQDNIRTLFMVFAMGYAVHFLAFAVLELFQHTFQKSNPSLALASLILLLVGSLSMLTFSQA